MEQISSVYHSRAMRTIEGIEKLFDKIVPYIIFLFYIYRKDIKNGQEVPVMILMITNHTKCNSQNFDI